jgi:hypothetical protein
MKFTSPERPLDVTQGQILDRTLKARCVRTRSDRGFHEQEQDATKDDGEDEHDDTSPTKCQRQHRQGLTTIRRAEESLVAHLSVINDAVATASKLTGGPATIGNVIGVLPALITLLVSLHDAIATVRQLTGSRASVI